MPKRIPTRTIPRPGVEGSNRLYELPNGLHASAICGEGAYGSDSAPWELHVVDTHGKPVEIDGLTVGAVVGWLTEDALDAALDRFAALS